MEARALEAANLVMADAFDADLIMKWLRGNPKLKAVLYSGEPRRSSARKSARGAAPGRAHGPPVVRRAAARGRHAAHRAARARRRRRAPFERAPGVGRERLRVLAHRRQRARSRRARDHGLRRQARRAQARGRDARRAGARAHHERALRRARRRDGQAAASPTTARPRSRSTPATRPSFAAARTACASPSRSAITSAASSASTCSAAWCAGSRPARWTPRAAAPGSACSSATARRPRCSTTSSRGLRTRVTGIFDLDLNLREFRLLPKTIHFPEGT